MKKTTLSFSLILAMLFSLAFMMPASAEDESSTDLVLSQDEVDEIDDDELTEAEPSDVPEVEEDEELAENLAGEMLLDVEGLGEVYYVDPIDGGKEYLADGAAAHRLLERMALGINEENFGKLIQGTDKAEESVCESSDLGKRLRGRIVLRVEKNGEAWWVFPRNCRAYYVGTHEAAYELMREFSLGVTKDNLGKIRDTKRQKLKRAVRFSVFAYAEDNGVSLEEAREVVKVEAKEVRQCIKDSGQDIDGDTERPEKRAIAKECLVSSDLPQLTPERREEIKDTIQEVREDRKEHRSELREIRIDKVKMRIREARDGDGSTPPPPPPPPAEEQEEGGTTDTV